MKIIKNILNNIFLNRARPFYWDFLYRACKRYVNIYNNDGNKYMDINGEFNFISQVKPQIVFDVGANVGEYSKEILRVNPKAEIHCFEPIFDIDLSNSPNIHINKVAVGSKNGDKEIHISGESTSFYDMPHISTKQKRVVKVITLKDYCRKNNITEIDLLKIDVEGHELEVLKGLDIKPKYIQFEFGNTSKEARIMFKDIVDLLKDYKFYKIMPKGLKRLEYSLNLENCVYANFVAKK